MNLKSKRQLELDGLEAGESLPLTFAKSSGFRVRIRRHRESVHRRFPSRSTGQHKLTELVLNEAEALAWQTQFPHLVFPTLADEMAESLAKWRARQEAVRRGDAEHSLAA